VQADGSVTAAGLTDAALAGATAGGDLQLRAAQHLVMADAERISAGGSLVLVAGGNLSLGDLRTPGAVTVVAGGNLLDGDGAADVTAASLLLQAGGSAGTAGAPIEIVVGQLAASAAGLQIVQTGALTVGSLSASLSVDGAAAQTVQLGGIASSQNLQLQVDGGDLQLNGNASTQGGSLGLAVSGGSLVMAGGSVAGSQGGAVSLAASGDVVVGQVDARGSGPATVGIQAGGDLRVAANAPATQLLGSTAHLAAGNILGVHTDVAGLQFAATGAVGIANLGDLSVSGTTAGPASIAAGRDLFVDGALSSAASLDVQAQRHIVFASGASADALAALRLAAGGDIQLGSLSSATAVSLVAGGSILGSAADRIDIAAPALRLQAGHGIGLDTASAADRLQTRVDTVSARAGSGGIWILEADAITIDDVAVSVVRVDASGQAGTVTDVAQSDLLTSANGSIGLRTLAGGIVLNDGSAPANGVAVKADGSGTVSLQAQGQGAVLGMPAQTIAQDGDVVLDSNLALQGGLVISAGQGGASGNGAITLTGAIDGQAGGAPDTLVLHADGAVNVLGAVGSHTALAGMAIDGATDVRFGSSVHLTGDLTVHASGTVEFLGDLVLDGGSLHIVGATRVLLNGVVIAQGDLVIDGAASLTLGTGSIGHGNVVLGVDALTLNGPLTSAGGALTIQPSAAGRAISLAESGDGLLLSAATLGNLRGFGAVRFETSGQVLVSTDTLSALAATGLDITGGGLSLQGGSANLQFSDHLALHASGDVSMSGRTALAAAGADFSIDSRGALRMAPASLVMTNGGDVTAVADAGITLGRVDTAGAAGSGGVLLQALAGHIVDADNDEAVNVHAAWLSIRGHGPALAAGSSTTAAAIDVQVDRLDADDQRGLMLRDTGADGRTRFNLLDNGVLYQQVVADGSPLRGSTAPIAPGAGGSAADASAHMAAWLQALRPLSELRQGSLLDGPTRVALAATHAGDMPHDSAASVYLATLTAAPEAAPATGAAAGAALDLLSDASFGLSRQLERAWLLGSGSQQPAASGLQAATDTAFDVWEESLAL
jgi:hypothetical protein